MKKLDLAVKKSVIGGDTYTISDWCNGKNKSSVYDYHAFHVWGVGISSKMAQSVFNASLKSHKKGMPNHTHSL